MALVKPPILQLEERRIRKEIESDLKRRYDRPFIFTPLMVLGGVAFLTGVLSIFQVWLVMVSVAALTGVVIDLYWNHKYAQINTQEPVKEQEEIVYDMEEGE